MAPFENNLRTYKVREFLFYINNNSSLSRKEDFFDAKFKILETLKPNTELLEIIKDYTYKVAKGTIKHILITNLQVIEPTEYLITYYATLTILKYKVNEISNKQFYIKEHNEKYNLKELLQILKNI